MKPSLQEHSQLHALRLVLAMVLSLGTPIHSATSIYVSPAGKDTNKGLADSPLASPHAARDQARQIIAKGLTEPLEIVFASGTYRLDSTLELSPLDSGTEKFPITWKGAPGAKVVWTGGLEIPAKWSKGENGLWRVDLQSVGPADWNFRQLFVDGKRSPRARFPNADAKNPFLYATGGDFDHLIIDSKLVKASWGMAKDAQINIVPQWRFFNQWNTVTKVDTTTGRIDIADSERHAKIIPGNWFWIEGVKEELDQPGEWFFDAEARVLYFMPAPGVDPNRQRFVAPVLNRLVHAQGDVNAETHVRYLHFDGIEFRHTCFTLGHIEARVHTDTVLLFENTLHCSVRNCHFENIGGYALWLHMDSRHNQFDRNTVHDSGGGGVLLTGARFSYMDDTKVFTPGEAAAKVAPILNEITRNTVEHCGKIRYYGGGVHLASRPFSMSMEPGNLISHNYFNDLSRNGVFAFRNQGGNVVEYNHIHNTMQTTIDGACIHFATMNHLNAPNFILNNWLYDAWGYEQNPDGKPERKLGNGIFLDWDTSNTTVRDNWIYNSVGGAIKPIWKNQNLVIENNRDSDVRIVPPFEKDLGPDGTKTNGIDLAANRLTGTVIHHEDENYVRTKGRWERKTVNGMWGLFRFDFLLGTSKEEAEVTYTLPIPEDGEYKIYLIYPSGKDRASNVAVTIRHANGEENLKWNMREGSRHGFAVEVGQYVFWKDQPATVTVATRGANGNVIADSVGFVKVKE